MSRIDPVTAAVIQGGLENVAIEMGHKLMRMSYSSIIRDSEDFGAARTDADGLQMCECKMSTPPQSGPIPGCARNVIARFCPGNQLADTVMKAFAQVVPHQVSAGIGNLRVVAISGLKDGSHWVHMEIMEGSYGGRFGMDGMDAVDTLYANTRNNPVEDIEPHSPIRVERYELRENAMAAGHWRGGIGTIREFVFLDDAGFSLEGDGPAFEPWGRDGGGDGYVAFLTLVRPDGTHQDLPSKVPYFRDNAGDRLVSYGPCGGGYGDASLRSQDAIASDVADGLIARDTAQVLFAQAEK